MELQQVPGRPNVEGDDALSRHPLALGVGPRPKRTAVAGQIESGLLSGIVATKAPAVGVETSESEDSSISFFQGNDLSSVDDIDLVAGRLATVFALLGAEGSFGVKSGADRLLPDLIVPPAPGIAPAARAPR